MLTERTYIQELLRQVPEFTTVHEKEEEDHLIGPTVVFGDLARFSNVLIEEQKFEVFRRVIIFASRCYYKSEFKIANAVVVAFFEHLDPDAITYFYEYFPGKLADEIKTILQQ